MKTVTVPRVKYEKIEQKLTRSNQELALAREELIEARIKIRYYEELLKNANRDRFGQSSEKSKYIDEVRQMTLFNEPEAEALPEAPEPELEQVVITRKKKRRTAKNRFDQLPTVTHEYFLKNEEKECGVCGNDMHLINTRARVELEMIPAQFRIVKHERGVYGCRTCEKESVSVPIVEAPAPKPLIRNFSF